MGKFKKMSAFFQSVNMLEKLYISYSNSGLLLIVVWEIILWFSLNACHFWRPHYTEIVLFIQVEKHLSVSVASAQ